MSYKHSRNVLCDWFVEETLSVSLLFSVSPFATENSKQIGSSQNRCTRTFSSPVYPSGYRSLLTGSFLLHVLGFSVLTSRANDYLVRRPIPPVEIVGEYRDRKVLLSVHEPRLWIIVQTCAFSGFRSTVYLLLSSLGWENWSRLSRFETGWREALSVRM